MKSLIFKFEDHYNGFYVTQELSFLYEKTTEGTFGGVTDHPESLEVFRNKCLRVT